MTPQEVKELRKVFDKCRQGYYVGSHNVAADHGDECLDEVESLQSRLETINKCLYEYIEWYGSNSIEVDEKFNRLIKAIRGVKE